ncbi:hypothetical protein MTO96_035310 [Rhipicephalus appendiculatus]
MIEMPTRRRRGRNRSSGGLQVPAGAARAWVNHKDGNVIGINTMKVTAGISFAIPADYAMNFLEGASKKSQEETSADRWYLGITMLTLTPSLILELQQRDPMFPHVTNGVLVWRVMLGSPANL